MTEDQIVLEHARFQDPHLWTVAEKAEGEMEVAKKAEGETEVARAVPTSLLHMLP